MSLTVQENNHALHLVIKQMPCGSLSTNKVSFDEYSVDNNGFESRENHKNCKKWQNLLNLTHNQAAYMALKMLEQVFNSKIIP